MPLRTATPPSTLAHRAQPRELPLQTATPPSTLAHRAQPLELPLQTATAPQYSGAQGAAAGYAAGNRNTPPVGAAHVALPTDAGYGMPAAGAGAAAYAGYHQTEAVSGSVYAARGAAVRTSYQRFRHVRSGLVCGTPGRLESDGLDGGPGMGRSHLACGRRVVRLGRSVQPIYYDYGNNITYQGDQVYYGNQPVATADQYYQQASTLAQSQPAPDPNTDEWMPLGVFGLVRRSRVRSALRDAVGREQVGRGRRELLLT